MISLVLLACDGVADAPRGEASAAPVGEVLFLQELGPPLVSRLDLATGVVDTRFSVPSGGFAYEVEAGEGGTFTLAYTAPPKDGGAGFDRSRIVRVNADDTLTDLACADAAGVWCFFPAVLGDRTWFVDGTTLSWVEEPGGEVHPVVPWATEPALADDRVAWVAFEPPNGARSLELGDAEGTWLRTLVPAGTLDDLARPFFSADGAAVYFVVPTPTALTRLDLLVPRARAHGSHDVPGDWWRVSVEGGEPEQVTFLDTVHYDGRAAEDGRHFVTATREGLVVVDLLAGTADTTLELRTARSVDWIE